MKDAARFHWIIWLGAAAALVVLLLPVVIVVMAGLTAGEYLTFPPQGLSLRWVVGFLNRLHSFQPICSASNLL